MQDGIVDKGENHARKDSEKKVYSKEEIAARITLVHGAYPHKWEKAQEHGALLSPREMVRRGLLKEEEITDLGITLTNPDDIALGKDAYVFLSVGESGYGWGGVHLTVDPEILNKEGVLVNTAGDSDDFQSPQELKDYYLKSVIPGSSFLDYLVGFVNGLPNPEWFFGERDREFDHLKQASISVSMELDRLPKGEPLPDWLEIESYKLFHALGPEIMVPDAVPLSSIVNARKDENYWNPNETK